MWEIVSTYVLPWYFASQIPHNMKDVLHPVRVRTVKLQTWPLWPSHSNASILMLHLPLFLAKDSQIQWCTLRANMKTSHPTINSSWNHLKSNYQHPADILQSFPGWTYKSIQGRHSASTQRSWINLPVYAAAEFLVRKFATNPFGWKVLPDLPRSLRSLGHTELIHLLGCESAVTFITRS